LTGVYKIKPICIGQLIGGLNNTEYEIGTSGYTTGLINLINYNKVMVRTENVAYYYSDVENIRTKITVFLLAMLFSGSQKQILQPFKILKYNKEDGGYSFVYKVENRQINSIIFELRNERNEIITDAPDYMMVTQSNFYEKQNIERA